MFNKDGLIDKVKKIHMIGIGGSGMCPLAEILHEKGCIITGSDNNESDPLRRVKALGIPVSMGHKAENVEGAELVVYSAAIHGDNPEIVRAKELGIPLMERADLLGAITRKFKKMIGVCGTHGKTTTSSMITQVLYSAGFDPTAVIGGKLPLINANGRVGKTDYMVCESCEFVDTFLKLSPHMAVLLNIDNDHLDYFKTMDNLVRSFAKFLKMAKVAVVNGDDSLAMKAAEDFDGELITYGYGSFNDYTAKNLKSASAGYEYDLYFKEKFVTHLALNVPGKHNVMNSMACFAACSYYGVPKDDIKSGIESFGGAGRRFEKICSANGITVIDDYAHHPTELKATLNAAKALPYKSVIAVFQPFTFSRTQLLKDDFIEALKIADKVVLMPIMGSREVNETGISSADLACGLPECYLTSTHADTAEKALEIARPGDIIITMGGGDVYKAAYIMRDRLAGAANK